MNIQKEYRSKITTADEAVRLIPADSTVVMSKGAGVPRMMVKALAEHRHEFEGKNVTLYHMTTLGEGECISSLCYGTFHHLTNFVGANAREIVGSDYGDFSPAYFKDVPSLLGNQIPCDVAVVAVTPPDASGYCSMGVSCDYEVVAVKKAKIVIAETNDRMPFTTGRTLVHISELDYIIPCSYELPILPSHEGGEVEAAIGKHCASLVEDGATIQVGIGAIPDAVLMSLRDKKDLGVHSEMFSDGVVDLVHAGVITNAKKTLHPGKMVATFLMGTRKLYDFIDNNPMVEMFPVDYVNNPYVIAKNDNMVSINSCLQIDLMGQVAAESIGPRQYSGPGGQVDFIRGASMSKGGKSIIAMPSTAANGTISRITATLPPFTAVTTSRNEVDYVVTEFGIAALKGRTLRQRAQSLIDIAHPDFRDKIAGEYERRFETYREYVKLHKG